MHVSVEVWAVLALSSRAVQLVAVRQSWDKYGKATGRINFTEAVRITFHTRTITTLEFLCSYQYELYSLRNFSFAYRVYLGIDKTMLSITGS